METLVKDPEWGAGIERGKAHVMMQEIYCYYKPPISSQRERGIDLTTSLKLHNQKYQVGKGRSDGKEIRDGINFFSEIICCFFYHYDTQKSFFKLLFPIHNCPFVLNNSLHFFPPTLFLSSFSRLGKLYFILPHCFHLLPYIYL